VVLSKRHAAEARGLARRQSLERFDLGARDAERHRGDTRRRDDRIKSAAHRTRPVQIPALVELAGVMLIVAAVRLCAEPAAASPRAERRVIIAHEGRTLLEIPLTLGVVGALLAPQVAALGALAALVTRCTLTIEHEEPAPPPGSAETTPALPAEPKPPTNP
jgi:Domain of unknown function (DUF4342)